MRFLTGDDTGILKWVHLEAQKVEKVAGRRRGDAAEKLCWGGPPTDRERRYLVAYASGALEAREATNGQVVSTLATAPNVRCLQAVGEDALAISADGTMRIVRGWCGEVCEEFNGEAEAGEATPLGTAETGDGAATSSASDGRIMLKGPVADADVDPCDPQRLIFGGGDNAVKLWDLASSKVTWTAKNLREDTLCLRVPLNISTLRWITPAAPARSMFLCGTTCGKLRLYDTKAQRRPLFELKVGYKTGQGTGGYTGVEDDLQRPVKCSLLVNTRGNSKWSFFVGNNLGVLREYDLRKLETCTAAPIAPGRTKHLDFARRQMDFVRGYKGIMGSIRSIDAHASGDAIAAVGLGRYAYIFDPRKKKMTNKVYLKQKLCSVLFSSEAKLQKDESDEEDKEDEEGPAEDEVQVGFSDDEGAAPQDEGDAATAADEMVADDDGNESINGGTDAVGNGCEGQVQRKKKRRVGGKVKVRKRPRSEL